MSLEEDLTAEVKETFRLQWTEESAAAVPDPEDLRLNANHAKALASAAVLYADLDGSTNMVDTLHWAKATELYKTYLRCASRIIQSEGGVITAYDGDRVMAVYTGDSKNTSAVRTALKINHAVNRIIRPAYAAQYAQSTFQLKHVVGVDNSTLRAARVGVRGDNDIVWVGSAANYAAKLCSLSTYPLWITSDVHDNVHESVKLHKGSSMWVRHTWNTMKGMIIYGSTYQWTAL